MHNSFGGDWTELKLKCLEEYMKSYNTALRKQGFKRAYIDLFAGSGKRTGFDDRNDAIQLAFDELGTDQKEFFDGSTRLALNVQPSFDEFFFGEKLKKNVNHLRELQNDYPNITIHIQNDSAKELLPIALRKYGKGNQRSILFLDPYGAQVDWTMLEQIAKTQSVDMFYLFPSGLVINRLLKKDGNIPQDWKNILNRMLGTTDWMNTFYQKSEPSQGDMFSTQSPEEIQKTATIRSIDQYFLKRLNSIFPYVGKEPLELKTPKGIHMFSLCFAIANPSRPAMGLAARLWNGVLNKVQS